VTIPDDEPQSSAADGAVRTLATRRAYTGKVINLDVDTVRFPNNSVGELEMIRHPGASAVVPLIGRADGDDPPMLLIKQYRYAADEYLYEIPAGRLDHGEGPLECARRELKEETGCSAELIQYLFTMFTTPGFTDEQIHVFMAAGLERGDTAHEPDEFLTLETVALSRALELIERGKIKDAKTALAILYVATFRRPR